MHQNPDCYLPCHDNEEIQAVPCVPEVALLAKNAQGHHLKHHLHGKEDEDEVIKDLWSRRKIGQGGVNSGARVEVRVTVRSNVGQEENLRGPCPLRLLSARRPGPREGMMLPRAIQPTLLIALAQAMTRTLGLSTRLP